MAGAVVAADQPVADDIGLLDQMLEILETIFQPANAGQRHRHIGSDLEKAVAERYLDIVLARQPARAHHVADLAMDVEHVARLGLQQLALARQVQILAAVDARVGARQPQPAQAVEIVARDRILDPVEAVAGTLEQRQRRPGFRRRPRFVGIGHDRTAIVAGRLLQQVEPVEIAFDIGMADLDLVPAIPCLRGIAEQLAEVMVGQVEIEPAGIDGHGVALFAEQRRQRQADRLGEQVPDRVLDRFLERQQHLADIAAARAVDAQSNGSCLPPFQRREGFLRECL